MPKMIPFREVFTQISSDIRYLPFYTVLSRYGTYLLAVRLQGRT